MTQPNYLKDILKTLGWNDGFQIPVADDENKALEAEVARLTLARLKAKTDCENASQKYEALERHMKFITQESEQIQKLLSAHKKQLDAENHYLRTSAAEKTRLLNDIRDTIKEEKEIKQKNNEKKGEIKRGMEKIEKIKKETFWDEEALKAWEQSLNKRDDDNNLLIKFSKEDEKNFLELEAKRASLQVEYLQREKTVAKMVNDLSNYESVIERTGKTIQMQLAERDALVVQWKETVKILHQRDDAISLQEDKLLETMEMIQKNQEILKNEESLLNIEKNNNKELERENEDLSAQYSRHQRNLDNVYQYVLLLNSEVNGIKRQVTKTANNLENERCKFKTLNKEIENKTNEIENVEKKLLKLMEKYENLKVVNMNVGERCKQLEKLIDYESKQHAVFMTDSHRLNSGVFRVQSKLTEQMDITVTRELDIVNMTTLIDTLQKMNKEVQTEVDKKKELIYNMEFKIDQMEDKLSDMEKQNVTEDNAEVYSKLKDLEKILADHVETKNLIQDQISRIQDEMRRLTTAIANDEQKLDVMQNKLQNEKLEYEGGMKQAEAAKHAAQEKQVEENILILKLKQFDHSMKKEESEIYNLQRMKINLVQAMRERELEVNSKKELLQVQKRNLDEDKGRLKSDLKNRHLKVDQLQSKYHLATMCLGTDEDGQTLTITHYKLKAAQDKYYLKQRGDTLDEKIRTTEKEIVAMENTLKIVNLTNTAFKKSMSEVEDSDKEALLMESLKKKFVETTDQLRELRKTFMSDKQELKDLNKEMEELKEYKMDLKQSLANVEIEYSKLQKELEEKLEKVKRTDNLMKKVEKKISVEVMAKYDRDLEVQHLAETNKKGLQKLCQIAESEPNVKLSLTNLANDYGIKLPEIRVSATRFSDTSFSSNDVLSTLSSDLKSLSSKSKGSDRGSAKSTESCHCSSSGSASIASVVLSFDGNTNL